MWKGLQRVLRKFSNTQKYGIYDSISVLSTWLFNSTISAFYVPGFIDEGCNVVIFVCPSNCLSLCLVASLTLRVTFLHIQDIAFICGCDNIWCILWQCPIKTYQNENFHIWYGSSLLQAHSDDIVDLMTLILTFISIGSGLALSYGHSVQYFFILISQKLTIESSIIFKGMQSPLHEDYTAFILYECTFDETFFSEWLSGYENHLLLSKTVHRWRWCRCYLWGRNRDLYQLGKS